MVVIGRPKITLPILETVVTWGWFPLLFCFLQLERKENKCQSVSTAFSANLGLLTYALGMRYPKSHTLLHLSLYTCLVYVAIFIGTCNDNSNNSNHN